MARLWVLLKRHCPVLQDYTGAAAGGDGPNVATQSTTFDSVDSYSHRIAQTSQDQHKSGAALVAGCVPVSGGAGGGGVQLFEGPPASTPAGRKLLRAH